MQLGSWIRANKILVGAIVALFLVFLLTLIAFMQTKPVAKNNTTATSANSSSQSHTTLSLHLVQLINDKKTNAPSIISVDMDTHGDRVTGDQFILQFDPKVILTPALIAVNSPSFFPNPRILAKNVDTIKGKISFAEIIEPNANPVSGKGSIAGLTFYISPTATVKTTEIKFIDNAAVSGTVAGYSFLQSVQNVTIPITQ